jgi:hypothetical protein
LFDVASDIAPMLVAATKAIRTFRIEFTSYQDEFSILVSLISHSWELPDQMISRTIVAISGEPRFRSRGASSAVNRVLISGAAF